MVKNNLIVLDAVSLFHLQLTNPPKVLNDLRQNIMNGNITAIIPTIAISEILWKKRREGNDSFEKLKIAYSRWKNAPNIIIDDFDETIIDKMMMNNESYELHDEIIAMTCHKYSTTIIYTRDLKFRDFWGLTIISW
ncbi:MAG: PIN domain-containing protein [Promethearchaeota archaeon]